MNSDSPATLTLYLSTLADVAGFARNARRARTTAEVPEPARGWCPSTPANSWRSAPAAAAITTSSRRLIPCWSA
ncbi:MAG: hypothetical protein MZV70_07690 [Desulfobacterales bacterium]|nr:hypothetical protein [Desulfobacterales bacterium]